MQNNLPHETAVAYISAVVDLAGTILICAAGYMLGAIPTGYLLGRAKGVDLRTVGSGNIGATNAMRVLGKPAGAVVLIVDALKGYLACTLLTSLILDLLGLDRSQAEPYRILAGVAAVLGHSFTCWLRFKGGKGVATGGGVYLALAPGATAVAVVIWAVVFAVSRYVSLASITAAVALAVAVWLSTAGALLRVMTVAVALLVVLRHRSNIARLLAGTEHRIGSGKPAQVKQQ